MDQDMIACDDHKLCRSGGKTVDVYAVGIGMLGDDRVADDRVKGFRVTVNEDP